MRIMRVSCLDTPVYLRVTWIRGSTFESCLDTRVSTFESCLDAWLYLRELPGYAYLPSSCLDTHVYLRVKWIRGPTFESRK